MRCRWGDAASDVTTPSLVTNTEIHCLSFARPSAGTVNVFVSLNAGADFHFTAQQYQFYRQPTLLRTGCLGATKGCLTTGPTEGTNPVQVLPDSLGFSKIPYDSIRFPLLSDLLRAGVHFPRSHTISP